MLLNENIYKKIIAIKSLNVNKKLENFKKSIYKIFSVYNKSFPKENQATT